MAEESPMAGPVVSVNSAPKQERISVKFIAPSAVGEGAVIERALQGAQRELKAAAELESNRAAACSQMEQLFRVSIESRGWVLQLSRETG